MHDHPTRAPSGGQSPDGSNRPPVRPVVLITGGRSYSDRERLYAVLDEIRPGLVIEGGCGGADGYARAWCRTRGVPGVRMEALWDFYGKAAGPIRNTQMVHLAKRLGGYVVAFPGGAGTADCVAKAEAAGLEVRRVDW